MAKSPDAAMSGPRPNIDIGLGFIFVSNCSDVHKKKKSLVLKMSSHHSTVFDFCAAWVSQCLSLVAAFPVFLWR